MRRAVVACLVLLLPATLEAQGTTAPPPRPRLERNADTNSATAYHQFGVRRLRQNPQEAAAAFYWASRLDPESADYLYSRWIALVIADPELLGTQRRGTRTRSAEARALDSLMMRSLMLNPFLHRKLDDQLTLELVVRSVGGTPGGDVEQYVRRVIATDPDWEEEAAQISYSRGQFSETLDILGRAMRRSRKNPHVRMARGRTFYLTGALDSARMEIDSALAIARRADADSSRYFYEQKSAWEYSLGRVLAQQNRHDAAREAFERALIEDLSYYPAHIQLGLLHIARRDTAAALREFGRAVNAREDEYLPRTTYTYYLASVGQLDSALVHAQRAIELEPHAAAPRLMLGMLLDATHQPGALPAFEAYVARAARTDPDLPGARNRVEQLRLAQR